MLRGFLASRSRGSLILLLAYSNSNGSERQLKRKEKHAVGASGKEGKSSTTPPPRIVDTSQRSLKSQLRVVKRLKNEEQGKGFAPRPRSKFRKKREAAGKQKAADVAARATSSGDKFAMQIQEEQALSLGKGISSLYNTKALKQPPAVLVDGYNVLMRWLQDSGEEVRKRKIAGNLEAGRLEILRDLSDYSGWRNLRMMVAFDAQGNPNAPSLARDRVGGVETVFVGTGEADSFIIGEARQLRKAGCPFVLVATSDNDIRDACWTDEIFPVSSEQLLQEIKKAKKEADTYYKNSLSRLRTDRLGSTLMRSNPALYAKLEKARIREMRHQ